MTEKEELLDHQVTAWTAGQLRRALKGMPVTVVIAEEPAATSLVMSR